MNRFGEYLSYLRKKKNITLEQLSDGLCDVGMLSRLEHGEREPNRLLQNRLLTRLGVPLENYECYLFYNDFIRWKNRQRIFHNILNEKWSNAEELLEKYKSNYSMCYPLEYQFYLAIYAQIQKNKGASAGELCELYLRALKLTVNDAENCTLASKALSIEEIDLFLEYKLYNQEEIDLLWWEKIILYIENTQATELSLAKLYPKAVYYFYLLCMRINENCIEQMKMLLSLCERAISILRDAHRSFFWYELFDMKEKLTYLLFENKEESCDISSNDFSNWTKAFHDIYSEYKVSMKMWESVYIYIEAENYCIGDTIRSRRKMLGMTMKQLSEGICDEKTISRLEHNRKETQLEIVWRLMERLHLAPQFYGTEIDTEIHEIKEQYKQLKKCMENRNISRIEELIRELKETVNLESQINRQIFLRAEANYLYYKNEITTKQYIDQLVDALECTIPYQTVVMPGDKFLTAEEISTIQNLSLVTNSNIDLLKFLYNRWEYKEGYLRACDLLMTTVSSYLGNIGDYNQSNEISRILIRYALQNHRVSILFKEIYNIIWNEAQRTGNQMCITGLVLCIYFCDFEHRTQRRDWYQNKLRLLTTEYD